MKVSQLLESAGEHLFISMLNKLKPEMQKGHVYFLETDNLDQLKLARRMYPSLRTEGAINIEVQVAGGSYAEWYVTLFPDMLDDYTIRKTSMPNNEYGQGPRWVIVRKDHAYVLEPLR